MSPHFPYFIHPFPFITSIPRSLISMQKHQTISDPYSSNKNSRKEKYTKNPMAGGASRWRKSKMWRSPSSPQIHQKHIYMWNSSYRTPTERWQKTSDLPKSKKLLTYLGRAKEKRKNRDKRIGMGPAPVGGSCEGGKVSTH